MNLKTAIIGIFVFIGFSGAHAQFGNFLQQLQKAIPQSGSALPAIPGGAATGNKQNIADQMCAQRVGAIGSSNGQIDRGLIASEFKIADPNRFQDDFYQAFKRKNISKTFPDVTFFQASFESKKVRAIYDTFLAYPEEAALVEMIKISKASDQQESGDALMALLFLHLQAPNLSASPNRWSEIYQQALKIEHWTVTEFRARLHAYGEYNTSKNIRTAVGYLVQAARIKDSHQSSEGRYEFDTLNYETIHYATAADIYKDPEAPNRQQFEALAKMELQSKTAQIAFEKQLPNTKIGRVFKRVSEINREIGESGIKMLETAKQGNQGEQQKASYESVTATDGAKSTFIFHGDPNNEKLLVQTLKDPNAKFNADQEQLLKSSLLKRHIAQELLSTTYMDLSLMMRSNLSRGDLVAVTAPLGALKEANDALIKSCITTSRIEQAMRSRNIPTLSDNEKSMEKSKQLAVFEKD